jgi:beta-phosphoglucomutase family hydrolase
MHSWSVIFDWDGVIVDSSRLHERAWHQTARETGRYAPPDFFKQSFGMKNDKVITQLLRWTEVPSEVDRLSHLKEETFRRLAEDEGLPVLPGVPACLRAFREAAVPCAVGSSAPRANIEFIIDRIGLRPFFKSIVCGEDVSRGKPDPEVFLTAANRLGTPASRCVVIEDAHVGIEAARAAGMKVVAVTTTHPAATLVDADLVLSGLDGTTPARIADLFTRRWVPQPT